MAPQTASERRFDAEGNLVAGVGQPLPEGVETFTHEQISTPADPASPAGSASVPMHDPVTDPPTDPVKPALHTPAEQVLVDAGKMKARGPAGGLASSPPADAPPADPPATSGTSGEGSGSPSQ